MERKNEKKGKRSQGTKTLKRALDILDLYISGSTELGIGEISRKLNVGRSTAVRYMFTLKEYNIVKKSAKSKYCLGGKIMKLANIFLSTIDIKTVAMPYLEELSEITGEAVNIYVRNGNERVCLIAVNSSHFVRGNDFEGQFGPLHAGAPGKLLLAFLTDDEIDKIIESTGLPRYTDCTITSKTKLKKEIEGIREIELAMSKSEHWDLTYAISAPIRSYTGKVIAALSIVGVIMRLNTEKEREFSILIKNTADKISQGLGYISVYNREFSTDLKQ